MALFLPMHFYHPTDVERNSPKRIQIAPYQIRDEVKAYHLHQSRVTFLCVPYGKIEILVRSWQEWEVTVIVIINEILFLRFCHFGIKGILTCDVFNQVAIGSDSLFDFPVFLFLRSCYDLVEVHLLIGKYNVFSLVGVSILICFKFMCIALYHL